MAQPDVAVIGGGIVGCATALFLAEAGARVTLYERASVAAGASGRNSGVVQHPLDPVLVALHRASLEAYRDLEGGASGPFALPAEPVGLLFVTRDPGTAARKLAEVDAAGIGMSAELLDPAALRDTEPMLSPGLWAVRLPVGFPVGPAAATRALAAAAERRGVTIRTGTAAVPALDGDRALGVRADRRLEAAAETVIAAGPWSPGLADPSGRWRPIGARWGVIVAVGLSRPPRHVLEQADIATEPTAGDPAPGAVPTARDAEAAVEFSLVTAAGQSGVGSTFLPSEPEPAAWAPALLRVGARFVPEVARAPVLGYRACARPQSLDGRPLVGRVPNRRNLWIAAGHGPWGISTAPGSARQVADMVLGRAARTGASDVLAACDPGRFGGGPA